MEVDMPSAYRSTYGVVSVTASTATINPAGYLGQLIVLNRAAGSTVTLPAATGSGNRYEFVVGTTVTSNSDIIRVANGTDVMAGVAYVAQDGGDTIVAFETAADSDTITMNGGTTGGIRGARIVLDDIAAGVWAVNVWGAATGTEASPFGATVS
jgi:hypothetical protein